MQHQVYSKFPLCQEIFKFLNFFPAMTGKWVGTSRAPKENFKGNFNFQPLRATCQFPGKNLIVSAILVRWEGKRKEDKKKHEEH